MKKKAVLTAAFVISLLPMLLNQYGGFRGVQEISGLMNLFNPIGILSALLFIIGVWLPKNTDVRRVLSATGACGIVASEIYEFFTWHSSGGSGEISLQNSMKLAFPEFYVGLLVSVVMVVFVFAVDKIVKE